MANQNGIAPEDYLRCLFEKAPFAKTEEVLEKTQKGILTK